jgi:hypothetical protein
MLSTDVQRRPQLSEDEKDEVSTVLSHIQETVN